MMRSTVVNKQFLDTGGHCMIHELTIEGAGELISVTINEELIVGRDTMYFETEDDTGILWQVASDEELYKVGLPLSLVADIIQGCREYFSKFEVDDVHSMLRRRIHNGQLTMVADALMEYSKHGFTVISPADDTGLDARDVAHYVLDVLNGLKCSFNHYYHDVENSYFIEDRM